MDYKNFTKKAIPLPLILGLAAVVTVAAVTGYIWMSNREITTSMTILASYGVGIWDEIGDALNTITFGDFYRGDLGTYPDTTQYTDGYTIENLGEDAIYLYFTIADAPTGCTIRLQQRQTGEPDFINWGSDTWLMTLGNLDFYALPSGETVDFRVSVSVGAEAEFGDFNPVLIITAYDTPDLSPA